MSRVYNFSAGPAVLPEEVLKEAAAEMLDYQGCGMSVMEMSHRSSVFQEIIETAEADIRELMHIPDNYKVLFLQGGASQQFAMIPMNLMKNKVADYIVTGQWAKKAAKEAEKYGEVHVIASSEDKTFSYIPDCSDLDISEDADYVYICENNTIYGTKFKELPNTKGKTLVADVSSCFLSEPVDVSKYGVIYGGVQKNVGPAGVVIAIIREDLITDDVLEGTPTMLKYKTHADAKSLYNTPPAYGIYICGKVFKWLKKQGGLEAIKERNEKKAKILYDYLDESKLFKGTVVPKDRSLMNVPFVTVIMYKYHNLNPISQVGLDEFTKDYAPVSTPETADAILVRSAAMHEMEFAPDLKAIARAGAGVNNIPLEKCAEQGIVVFNTPGANANGVKELVIAGMLLASRDIIGGINWVQENEEDGNIAKDAEKAKKAFAGQELEGKKLGVIGLGAIGVLVANAATHLGMDVYGYDPYVSVDSAWRLSRSIHHTTNVDEIYENCDYITVHVPALDSTKGRIGKDALGLMKEGVIVLNFARDVLVDSEAMVDALVAGKVKHYVTDFPTPEIAGVKGAIVIPHLGASTEESEDNCAKMAVKEVMDYLENGNIKHSVNYPDCDMGLRGDKTRILVLHHNVPNMIGQISAILAKDNMNIADLTNKSKGKYAYTMIDVDSEVPDGVVEELKQIGEVLRVRVIC